MNPLETVVALQRSLSEARRAEERLHGLPEWMAELDAEHRRAQGEIDALVAASEAASGERRAAEQGIAGEQDKLKQYQGQMSQVRNQREYGALLQEIDHAKSALRKFEEQALAALDKVEKLQAEIDAKKEAFGAVDAQHAAELKKWEAEKPALVAELERLQGRIAVLREQLPRPARAQFERIYERLRGDAVAPLARAARSAGSPALWHCGTCNYQVRPQVAMEIRTNGTLVPCEGCKRLLFPEEFA